MKLYRIIGFLCMGVLFSLGCENKEASQDFEQEVGYWVCSRDKNEFTCTFDELAAFQKLDGNYSRPLNCPSCGKNDKVTRLPDTEEIKERFRKKAKE